jgi:hypothetical protein
MGGGGTAPHIRYFGRPCTTVTRARVGGVTWSNVTRRGEAGQLVAELSQMDDSCIYSQQDERMPTTQQQRFQLAAREMLPTGLTVVFVLCIQFSLFLRVAFRIFVIV